MTALLLVGLIASVVYIVRLSSEVSELRDVILWYRRALAEHRVDWAEVERSRLVAYKIQPELRPGGLHREGEGVRDMQFVSPDEANASLGRFERWWRRIRSSWKN